MGNPAYNINLCRNITSIGAREGQDNRGLFGRVIQFPCKCVLCETVFVGEGEVGVGERYCTEINKFIVLRSEQTQCKQMVIRWGEPPDWNAKLSLCKSLMVVSCFPLSRWSVVGGGEAGGLFSWEF